jgi:hypothetical protein
VSFGPPPPPSWIPPTDIEETLFDAKMRDDWAAFHNALAYVNLYYQSDREILEKTPELYPRRYFKDPRTGDMRWELFTDGMLPAPQPDVVFSRARLRWIGRVWSQKSPPWIAINPGSPCEVVLPYGPPGSTDWSRAAEHVGDAGGISMRLRALSVGGALHGPVAHGLACGRPAVREQRIAVERHGLARHRIRQGAESASRVVGHLHA